MSTASVGSAQTQPEVHLRIGGRSILRPAQISGPNDNLVLWGAAPALSVLHPEVPAALYLEGPASELQGNQNKVPLPSPADDPSYEYPESPSKRYEHFDNLDDFL
ncbi:Adenine deaminase [Colletotrichum fructicola]|nr:Adenine deaminase [Colletotrichum fructicola]